MDELNFQWNEARAAANIKNHNVSFDEAKTVFSDELARLITDPDNAYGEERFIILGESSTSRLLIVCHCYRDKNDEIRIISARKANRHKQKAYKELRNA